MKKTLKTIIATLLAFTFAFCSVPAFAFQNSETVEWEDEHGTYADCFVYAGEMTEGTALYEVDESANCCKLNLEKEGFYLFSYDAAKVSEIFFSSSVSNNHPKGYADVLCSDVDGRTLAYIGEEETYAGFIVEDGVTNAEITVEYYDSKIFDIEFEDGAFENLIFGADFQFTENEKIVQMKINAEITFENGEVFSVDSGDFIIESAEAFGKGDRDVTVSYHGYREDGNMTIKLPSDYIAKIEVENIEDYLYVVEYPNGEIISGFAEEAFENEKVTITYHDGTTEVINSHEVFDRYELPNGRYYDMWYLIEERGEGYEFVIRVAGQNLLVKECEVRKANVFESLSYIRNFLNMHIRRINYMFKDTLNGVIIGNVSPLALFTFLTSEFMRDEIGYIFEGIAEFIAYCR